MFYTLKLEHHKNCKFDTHLIVHLLGIIEFIGSWQQQYNIQLRHLIMADNINDNDGEKDLVIDRSEHKQHCAFVKKTM